MSNQNLIEIKKAAEDAWLGIFAKEHTLFNPLEHIPKSYRNEPHLYFTYLMSRPEYFSFICKELLNITIYPFQSVVLNEVWNHQFPMLVASRGASKCVHYDTLILTREGVKKIGDVVNSDGQVYFDDLEVYSEDGWQKVEYGWCNGVKDTVIIECTNGMEIECTLNHPLRKFTAFESKKGKYIWTKAGKLNVGDFLRIKAPDDLPELKPYSDEYVSSLSSMFSSQEELPKSVYRFTKENLLDYISNVGFVNKNFTRISSFHKKKLKDLQVLIFWATGLCSKLYYQHNRYNLKIFNKKNNKTKIVKITKSRTKTYDLHLYTNHSFLSNGFVSHNSYTLALYALLRATLLPGRKIIIVGSVFRQSKVIFNYLSKMYYNSPLLRDANPGKGPKMYPDRCELQIGESLITALPIGCLSKDTMITTDNGIFFMGDFSKYNYPNSLWTINGYKEVGYFFDNGVSNCKKITTVDGYSYTGTLNHKMRVVRNNEIVWCRTDNITENDYLVLDKSERWFNSEFDSNDEQGYALGCMIGDGSYIRNDRLQFTTSDSEFIERLKVIGDFKKYKRDYQYYFNSLKDVMLWKKFWQLESNYAIDKKLPINLLRSKKSVVANCLAGIFDTDGHIFTTKAKGGIAVTINYTSISETLLKQIQYVLLHFGIMSSLRSRHRKNQYMRNKLLNTKRVYELMISGPDVLKFYQQIPIKLKRKKDILEKCISEKTKFNSIKKGIIPVDKKILIEIAEKYNLGHRLHVKDIERKKTITKNYLIKFLNKCKKLSINNDNIEILSKFISKDYAFCKVKTIEDVYNIHTVDFNIPDGNEYIANGIISHNSGDTIRGYRSNDTLADEFASQSREIFETVVAGFSSVSQDPIQNTKDAAALAFLKSINQPVDNIKRDDFNKDNQIVLTGSAYYYFNHFAQYWEKWKSIIYSKGDTEKLNEIFKGEIPQGFDWKDYCVLRIPYELLPIGFMSDANIARSKATMTSDIFSIEFSAVFSKDSNGFFKASSIEASTANEENNIILPSSENKPIIFDPKVKGDPNKEYVFGIDPASEVDNFSIVILEVAKDHNKIVYCWTTNAKKFKRKLQKGLIDNKDYYGFCARKIRDLMKDFNCAHIALDAQGGGKAVYEAFHDEKNMHEGETALWEIIEFGKKKDSDGEAGKHIVELVQFASYDYVSSANHNLKKDIEDKVLLFPQYRTALLSFENAINQMDEEDLEDTSIYDTLEDCIIEVQELKSELAQIVVTNTVSGRERWDTPETKISGSKKGRARKDRYSALLMANAAARRMTRGEYEEKDLNQQFAKTQDKSINFIGPKWATEPLSELYND